MASRLQPERPRRGSGAPVIPSTSTARYGLRVKPPEPSLDARLAVALSALDERARRRAAEQDWHPELLDAHDPDERATLIRLAHPDLDEAIEQDLAELRVGGSAMNPRLHLIVHEMIATQIIDDDPPEVFQTAQRLLALGRDPHEVLHMLGSIASTQIWTALHEQQKFSREDHLAALAALPERWDEQARQQPARHAGRSSGARRR
jgi:hypothetical protein